MVTGLTLSAGGGVYTNEGFTGKVAFVYNIIIEGASVNDTFVRLSSTLRTLGNVPLDTVTKDHAITPTTSTLSGNVVHRFEILESDKFPEELKLDIIVQSLDSGGKLRTFYTQEFIVNFTGEQPSISPTGEELAVNFDFTKIFELRAGE